MRKPDWHEGLANMATFHLRLLEEWLKSVYNAEVMGMLSQKDSGLLQYARGRAAMSREMLEVVRAILAQRHELVEE